MTVQNNISLKAHNTFGIDVKASQFCNIETLANLKKVLSDHRDKELFILGGGSNMLLTKDIDALVLYINMKGIDIVSQTETDVLVKASAGENWHEFVMWCIANDYGGIENLSLIPGNVGTAPIQNIGAYGVELKDVFVSCEAVKIEDQTLVHFDQSDCQFGYRESIFKQHYKGQYIITSVTFKLTKTHHKINIVYGAIKSQLEAANIETPKIKDVSNAVIAIRQSKLPDPKEIGNSGSFFKNPIITLDHFKELQQQFSEIPHYVVSSTLVKVPAGWLIEKAGFKGKRFENYGVHEKQALVLVNYGGASGSSIHKLALLIQDTIKRLFDIQIEMEVNVI